MAVRLGDPRYNLSFSLKHNDDTFSRTISYVNMAVGGSSTGYSAEEIFDFAEAVASLAGSDGNEVAAVNINAQYPLIVYA